MNLIKKIIMTKFYVSIKPQTNEIHSIHREGCPFMPEESKRIYVGAFSSVSDAAKEGMKYFSNSCTCRFCNKESSVKVPFNIPQSLLNGQAAVYSETMLSYMN